MARLSNMLRFSQRKLTAAQKRKVRRSANAFRAYFAGAGLALYAAYCLATGASPWDPLAAAGPHDGGTAAAAHGRKLSGGGCTSFTDGQGGGHVVGYLALSLYMFLGLAVVCDEWFVPSLEKISETLNLSADVAGATFLAAGSSAPEFFTSLADTFSTSNSVGVGTIVGSAMFNILVIVAMAAASTKETLNIDWRPVVRDCGFYGASIATLIIFFQDGRIYWWEGLVMTLLYALYILFMVFNAKIFKMCEKAKVEPEPGYAPGRRKSVHHHKGMFQGKQREVVLKDGTKGELTEEGTVKTADGEVAVALDGVSADAENPSPEVEMTAAAAGGQPAPPAGAPPGSGDAAALAAALADAPKAEDGGGGDDDDEDDPDDYFSRFKWYVPCPPPRVRTAAG